MDDYGDSPYKGLIATVRKKRSQTPRRPRTGNLTATGFHDQSHLTSHSMGIYNLNYFMYSKSDVEKKPMKNVLKKQGEKGPENLKIQRRPMRRLVLSELDEDEDDNEIHYSEKLKLKANKNEMLEDVGSLCNEVKRISIPGFDQYTYYEGQLLSDDEEEELLSDDEEEEQVS